MVLFGPVTFCSRNYTVLFPWYCTSASTVQVSLQERHLRNKSRGTWLGYQPKLRSLCQESNMS